MIRGANRLRLLAGSLALAFFLIPLYPAFIALTSAPVPGVAVVPKSLALAVLGTVSLVAVFWSCMLLAAPKQRMPTLAPMAAFPLAALAAALLGFDPLASALFIAILAGGVIWHATILRFARDETVLTAIFGAYLLSGALASLAAIVMVLAKTPAALYTIGHGRAIGTFVLSGELAGYLIVYVPLAYAIARAQLDGMRGQPRRGDAPTRPKRLLTIACAGLALGSIAFVLTFSRAGWVGMGAALAALVLMQRRRNGAAYAIAILGAAVAIVFSVFNAHHDASENFTRPSIWEAALRAFERFPLSGLGPFEFARLYPLVRVPGGEPAAYHAHSLVLTIAAETGIAGVSVLFFGWWRFVANLRAHLRANGPYAAVSVAIAAGLIGTWVQGLIDTISVVLFGLWLPMTALAIVCARTKLPANTESSTAADRAGVSTRMVSARPARAGITRRTVLLSAIAVFILPCAFVQIASSAVYGFAGSPLSFPAHLSPQPGIRAYEAIERIAPLPFAESVLTDDALRRGDSAAAAAHAARIPAGPVRSDFQARIAAAQGRTDDAIRLFLEAGDDEAIQPIVESRLEQRRVHDAYELERRVRDRLAEIGTRPNALADSWWRLGRLALRLGDATEAAQDDDRAIALAPLNTKYLIDAARLARQRHDALTAAALFARAREIDPSDPRISASNPP